jgi:hypothetical protein
VLHVFAVHTHWLPVHVSGELQLPPRQQACPVAPQGTHAPLLLHTFPEPHVPHETPHPLSPHVLPAQLPMQLQMPFGLHCWPPVHMPHEVPQPLSPHIFPVHVQAVHVPIEQ